MRSLRLKLIVWFLSILFIVIVTFSVLLYFTKQRSLYTSVDAELAATAIRLSTELEIEHGKITLKSAESNLETQFPPFLYKITTEKGEVISQTPILKGFVWQETRFASAKPVFKTIYSRAKHRFRIINYKTTFKEETEGTESGSVPDSNIQTVYITCAVSLRNIVEQLEDLSYRLISIGLITFLIAGLGGFFLANRVLRPINQISETLSGISDTQLSSRIDITRFDIELHPLAIQLNAALDRLETAFYRERQFTADASHELRTPLSVIVNNIEVLLKRPRTTKEHLEIHESNLQTAQHMQTIIEGLLTLSRIDAGRIILQKKPVQLFSLIDDIFKDMQAKVLDKQVCLVNEVDKTFQINADVDKLKQAILNLVENAIVYNHPRGSVTIKSKMQNGQISIEIIDTGGGIKPEQINRIFERFYRVDPSRSSSTGGCGLGLSIARSIIELHQGTISVTSNLTGSIFTIILPQD